MRVRLLGTAAGGGVPQWNCRCPNCRAARQGLIAPAAQCCLAFSPDDEGWYLVNATSDLPQHLARWPELHPSAGVRSTPVRGVILTDGELDHVMGLLHLREGLPWTLYATPTVATMLGTDLPALPVLQRYADVQMTVLPVNDAVCLGGGRSRVEVRLVETGRRPPRYRRTSGDALPGAVAAVTLRNPLTGKRLVYAPCVPRLSAALREELTGADAILFDGTFWANDELSRLGISGDHAREMGHVPVGGQGGSALWLSEIPAGAKLYVHLNNTNPLLDPASPERAGIQRLGLRVGTDGWQASL